MIMIIMTMATALPSELLAASIRPNKNKYKGTNNKNYVITVFLLCNSLSFKSARPKGQKILLKSVI